MNDASSLTNMPSSQQPRLRVKSALLALLMVMALPIAAQTIRVGPYGADTVPWQEIRVGKSIAPNRHERRTWDGVDALEVHSALSMSLMARPLEVDLQATPVLCWRWRVDAVIDAANLYTRQGDDYAARVYVSLKLPESAMGLALRTKLRLARNLWGSDLPDAAINYIWDNRHPVGTEQANAYTDRAIMVVMRSGNSQAGRWIEEKRHVLNDARRLFGASAQATQIAIAADTDNTASRAHAGFADFHFVPEGAACRFPAPKS